MIIGSEIKIIIISYNLMGIHNYEVLRTFLCARSIGLMRSPIIILIMMSLTMWLATITDQCIGCIVGID